MRNFTHNEKVDMYEVSILARKNTFAEVRMYQEKYPEREVPSHRYFPRLEARLRANTTAFVQKPRSTLNNNVEIDILAYFEANPRASIRMAASEYQCSVGRVHKILKRNKYRAYKLHKVQHLHLGDHERRLEFCHLLLNEGRDFLKFIIWTDESNFSNNGIFNARNNHYWSTENPIIVRERGFQRKFSVNVWCAILKDKIFFYMYEGTLTGDRYLQFLRDALENMLDDVPLNVVRDLYYQQDGAPAHNAQRVTQYLNEMFPNQWIGTNGPIAWPARSPDLNPLDFFLWGYLKDNVYKNVYTGLQHLKNSIENVLNNIDGRTLRSVRSNLFRRIQLCINENGGQFEQYL